MNTRERTTFLTEHPDALRFLCPPELAAEVAREIADDRERGLLRDWTRDVDTKLASVLSARGMRVGPDYPVIRHVRPRFARAWLDVLKATEQMLRSEPDLALLDPEGFGETSEREVAEDRRQRHPRAGKPEAPAWAALPLMMHFDEWTKNLKMEPRQLSQYKTDVQEFRQRAPNPDPGPAKAWGGRGVGEDVAQAGSLAQNRQSQAQFASQLLEIPCEGVPRAGSAGAQPVSWPRDAGDEPRNAA